MSGSTKRKLRTWMEMGSAYTRSQWRGYARRAQFNDVETFCIFVGYPSSGHSLVGSLLDAHPEIVISHELDVLRYIGSRFSRRQVLALILESERKGRPDDYYNYSVPGGWQGRFEKLRVMGDKKGGASTLRLQREPALLERLRELIRARIRLVHVTRNPFDSISTWMIRRNIELDDSIRSFLTRCEGVSAIKRESHPGEMLDIRYESLVKDPKVALSQMCDFLGVVPGDEYLNRCADAVFDSPARRRADVDWSDEQRERVAAQIARYDFLTGYSFET